MFRDFDATRHCCHYDSWLAGSSLHVVQFELSFRALLQRSAPTYVTLPRADDLNIERPPSLIAEVVGY